MPGAEPARLTFGKVRRVDAGGVFGAQMAAAAYALFTCQDAAIKYLLSSFVIWQLLTVRSAVVLAGCFMGGGPGLLRKCYTSPVRWVLAIRACTSLAAWWCFFEAAKTLPMGDLTTLYLVAPIMATALSAYFLRERPGLHGCVALLLGVVGTLVAVDPGNAATLGPTLLVFAGAGFWASTMVLMRWIGGRETALVQLTSTNLVILGAASVMVVGSWRVPSVDQAGMMAAVGLLSGLGQWLLIAASRRTPVAVTASLQYTGLLWAFILGFLVWGSIPGPKMLLGATLIGLAGASVLITRRPTGVAMAPASPARQAEVRRRPG